MTLQEFKDFNRRIGNHWFIEGTMAFFDSKIHDFCEDSGLFISSEKGPTLQDARKYTIRRANFETGRVSTVSAFQEYDTLSAAQRKMKKMIIYREDETA